GGCGPTRSCGMLAVEATMSANSAATNPIHDLAWQGRTRRIPAVLLVGEAMVLALAIDWLLVPRSYPVAAAYGVALLLAAHLLRPAAVVITMCLALALSVASNLLQGAPSAAWLTDNTSLLLLGALAWLLARQREVARTARQVSEASRRQIALAYEAARALAEATTLEAAGTAMLVSIGQLLDWTYVALWYVEATREALQCVATWHQPQEQLDSFEQRP